MSHYLYNIGVLIDMFIIILNKYIITYTCAHGGEITYLFNFDFGENKLWIEILRFPNLLALSQQETLENKYKYVETDQSAALFYLTKNIDCRAPIR